MPERGLPAKDLTKAVPSSTASIPFTEIDGYFKAATPKEIVDTAFSGGLVIVKAKSDLPAPSSGVITLAANTAYLFIGDVDLTADRLVASQDTVILGTSSESSSITSTGLGSTALITSGYTMPMRHILIKDVQKGFDIDQGANPNTVALDWTGVNFQNCAVSGRLGTVDNFVFTKGALLQSGPIRLEGACGTFSVSESIAVGDGSAINLFEVAASATITRRWRMVYSSVVAFGSTVGISFDAGATVPTEAFILDTVSFSGGGTYLAGVLAADNKALFTRCTGITNTSVNGQAYMQGNATATTIAATSTFYKALGATAASSDNSRYDHASNRLTNRAVVSRRYLVLATLSVSGGANKVLEFGLYDSKLGAVRTPSRTQATTNSGGRAENVALQCIVEHSDGHYVELHVANTTDTTSVTVESLNLTITELGN